ncbi:MAG: CNNM domain-containing protein, partial [Verrucomicrobiota bacterium]
MQTIYLAAGGSSGGVSVDRGKLSESLQKVFEATPEQIESVWSGISEATGGGNIYLLITFFAVSIGVSFFCSIWEAVLLSITRPFIADYKKKKPKTGAKLEFLKDQLDQPLTAILTLNTVAHTVGAMGVGREVSKLVGGGWLETAAGVFMTLAVLIASEIIPKNLGAKNWRSWAGWVSTALYALTKFWPMRLVIMVIGLFSKGGHHKPVFNRDELEVMAEMGRDQGQLKEEESRILTNLLNLRDTKVDDVMTPRVVIFALQHDSTVQEYVNEHADSPFSRIPIFTENRDDIGGFVLKDDILLAAAQDKLDVTLLDL